MAAENIGLSPESATPRRLMGQWMGSAAHRRNMMSRRYRSIGIGVAKTRSGMVLSAVELGIRG